MKTLTIGRSHDCDIVIHDRTETISRRQAELDIDFWGLKVLRDTSRNGTKVNGMALARGEGARVRRGDRITFGPGGVSLDWCAVRSPYRAAHRLLALGVAAVIALGVTAAVLRPHLSASAPQITLPAFFDSFTSDSDANAGDLTPTDILSATRCPL